MIYLSKGGPVPIRTICGSAPGEGGIWGFFLSAHKSNPTYTSAHKCTFILCVNQYEMNLHEIFLLED